MMFRLKTKLSALLTWWFFTLVERNKQDMANDSRLCPAMRSVHRGIEFGQNKISDGNNSCAAQRGQLLCLIAAYRQFEVHFFVVNACIEWHVVGALNQRYAVTLIVCMSTSCYCKRRRLKCIYPLLSRPCVHRRMASKTVAWIGCTIFCPNQIIGWFEASVLQVRLMGKYEMCNSDVCSICRCQERNLSPAFAVF